MARYIDIHPVDPQPRLITQLVQILREGGLIAYPTDSGYALGAAMGNQEALQRIRAIRQLNDKHHFTLVCSNFAQMGQLVNISNDAFRNIKAVTPGPYTFILPATKEVPKRMQQPKKKTVGVRIPDHKVTQALLDELGEPLLSSTLILPDQELPMVHGWEVKEELDHVVDAVVDAEETGTEPTTVIDYTDGTPEIARYGAGSTERFEG